MPREIIEVLDISKESLPSRVEKFFDLGEYFGIANLVMSKAPTTSTTLKLYRDNTLIKTEIITGNQAEGLYTIEANGINKISLNNSATITTSFNSIKFFAWGKEKSILLQSNNKTYSIVSKHITYETKMTSNTAPSPLVASASSIFSTSYPAWRAFANSNPTGAFWLTSAYQTGWIQIDYGTLKKLNTLSLYSTNESDHNARIRAPKKIEIQASNDGTTFDSLAVFDDILYTQANEQKDFKFDNERDYRYYRLNVDNKSGGSYVGVGKILYSYKKSSLTEIPNASADNFVEYGADEIRDFNYILISKNYILQDEVSVNEEGLWISKLDRKPLSIGFN